MRSLRFCLLGFLVDGYVFVQTPASIVKAASRNLVIPSVSLLALMQRFRHFDVFVVVPGLVCSDLFYVVVALEIRTGPGFRLVLLSQTNVGIVALTLPHL